MSFLLRHSGCHVIWVERLAQAVFGNFVLSFAEKIEQGFGKTEISYVILFQGKMCVHDSIKCWILKF